MTICCTLKCYLYVPVYFQIHLSDNSIFIVYSISVKQILIDETTVRTICTS